MRFGIYPNLGKADLKQALTALTGLLRLKKIDYSFPISMREAERMVLSKLSSTSNLPMSDLHFLRFPLSVSP